MKPFSSFRGDRVGGTTVRRQVKPLLPAPALRDRRLPIVAAGPRRILGITLVLPTFVIAAAAGGRLAADPLARADLLDLLLIPQQQVALRLLAIGVALCVGVATFVVLARGRR